MVKAITAEVDEGLFLPKGKLNEIRRLGLDAFTAGILSGYKRDPAKCFDTKPISSGQNTQHEDKNPVPDVRVFVLNADQARTVGSSGADALIVPMSLYSSLSEELLHTAKKIYVSLPYVIRNEKRIRDFIRDHDVAGYYVSNFEALYILKELSFDGEIVADMHMYAYNKKAYEHFRDRGIRTTVPVELNRHELIRRGIFGEEMIIYGKLPMMISANCVYNTKTGCRSVRGGHDLYITDRKSERFFVHCDCDECTNVIYNSVPLSAADEDSLFARLRPSSVRFMFTDERDDMVSDMIGSYLSGRNSNGSINTKPSGRYTKGHLNRGVE